MWDVVGPLLRVLRGLRVMGAFLHGGTSARVSVVLGAVIFGGIAVFGPTSLVGGLLSYAAFAFVGWHIIRAGKRLRWGRGRA